MRLRERRARIVPVAARAQPAAYGGHETGRRVERIVELGRRLGDERQA